MRKQIFNGLVAIVLLVSAVISVSPARAESVNYTYDDLNRLIRAEYGNGSSIEYTYDEAGNALERRYIGSNDTTPPAATASQVGGTYAASQSVALRCSDGTVFIRPAHQMSESAVSMTATAAKFMTIALKSNIA